ncbi:hypothetical protein AGMMS50293_23660 [Spirochaetia bacterium]|nr:hypothetical protein AGMMS50293_23660 [Spirochaetia bacterium]
MSRRIYLFEHEGTQALGFDTGLDSRSFAQAKLAQFITGPGLIVSPAGGIEIWKASGVAEVSGNGPSMVIWGPPFAGERLDMLIADKARQDEALAAITHWIRARLALAASNSTQGASLLPYTALIAHGADSADGTVFFCPEQLALRCLQAEGETERISGGEAYIHPDLTGMKAAAFTAGAMLYRVLTGAPPFATLDEDLLHQDIRDSCFLPPRLAAPGLDEKFAALIQQALSPAAADSASGGNAGNGVAGGANNDDGTALLYQFLDTLQSAPSLFRPLSADEQSRLIKEKEQFLNRKNLAVKTKRFVIRNTAIILGCAAALIIALLTARSIIKSRSELPSTKGMDSSQVIQSYYNAFGDLDHPLMDACLAKGAGKNDLDMVLNLYVINRVRQAYEFNRASSLISAREWQEQGALPAEAQIFGITDLTMERISGDETTNEIRYHARYTLWFPNQDEEPRADKLPKGVHYTDELTLIRRRGNWQIVEIKRSTAK